MIHLIYHLIYTSSTPGTTGRTVAVRSKGLCPCTVRVKHEVQPPLLETELLLHPGICHQLKSRAKGLFWFSKAHLSARESA